MTTQFHMMRFDNRTVGAGHRFGFFLPGRSDKTQRFYIPATLSVVAVSAKDATKARPVDGRVTYVRDSMRRKVAFYKSHGLIFSRRDALDAMRHLGLGARTIAQAMAAEPAPEIARKAAIAEERREHNAELQLAVKAIANGLVTKAECAKIERATIRATEGTKEDRLVAMLRRPGGAPIDEIASTFGWQKHTVRGAIAGTIKKKLGLPVASAKVDGKLIYQITA